MECIFLAEKVNLSKFNSFAATTPWISFMENVANPRPSVRSESSEFDYIDNFIKPAVSARLATTSQRSASSSPEKRRLEKGLRSPTKSYSHHSSPIRVVRSAATVSETGRTASDELLRSFLAVDRDIKFRPHSTNSARHAWDTAVSDRDRLSVYRTASSDRSASPARNRNRLEIPLSSDNESEGERPRWSNLYPRPSNASLAPTAVASTRPSLSTTVQSPSVYNKSSSPSSPDRKKRRPLVAKGGKMPASKEKREKAKAKARKVEESAALRTDELIGQLPRRTKRVSARREYGSEVEEESSVEESDQYVLSLPLFIVSLLTLRRFDESVAIERVARKGRSRSKGASQRTSKRRRKASSSRSPNSVSAPSLYLSATF